MFTYLEELTVTEAEQVRKDDTGAVPADLYPSGEV